GATHGALEAEARFTRIFVSAVEHPSVIANAAAIAERVPGVRVMEIPVTVEGIVNTGALQIMLREGKGRTLVATMAVNNETGVIQPLDAITAHVREAGALLLVDAVQAAGKMPVSFDADYLTLSGHKLGALQGVGALIVKESAPFAALVRGGGQERGKRAGTENVVGIASFGAVAGVPLDLANLAGLRDRFEAGLRARWTDTIVFGGTAPRIANTSNFAIPGLTAEIALMALDLDGICVSSGAACSSGKVGASPVLTAMGVADNLADCALRVSFGWNSQEADVDALLASLEKLIARARPRAAA
ncbi:MAG TPA: aminotransferase class V-fold PLP-dependent enzyme, partial [Rhizomicrobium sp.]|nr:aminotransferase class V-fold PLP-dependent enzyme [Rhizomicrobium sp.]